MADSNTGTPRWVGGIEPAKELLTATGTEILEIECREQPKKLSELIRTYSSNVELLLLSSLIPLAVYRARGRGRLCSWEWARLTVRRSVGRYFFPDAQKAIVHSGRR